MQAISEANRSRRTSVREDVILKSLLEQIAIQEFDDCLMVIYKG